MGHTNRKTDKAAIMAPANSLIDSKIATAAKTFSGQVTH